MKYSINGKESSLKEVTLLWLRKVPNVCIEDVTKRLTTRFEKQDYYGTFTASEYNVCFYGATKALTDVITVKF